MFSCCHGYGISRPALVDDNVIKYVLLQKYLNNAKTTRFRHLAPIRKVKEDKKYYRIAK